eukprot:m.50765 g.50765  ORF g.50765 m.50765 type:complete len:68 (+) comp11183_c0_seq2:315-518(+)
MYERRRAQDSEAPYIDFTHRTLFLMLLRVLLEIHMCYLISTFQPSIIVRSMANTFEHGTIPLDPHVH